MLSLVSPEMQVSAVELRKQRDLRDKKRSEHYDEVLKGCQSQILRANERDVDNIFFRIPVFKLGRPPIRNLNACIAYVLVNLKRKGFQTNFIYPDMLFVCWADQSPRPVPLAFSDSHLPVIDSRAPPPGAVDPQSAPATRTKAEKLLDINKTVCRPIPDSARVAPRNGSSQLYDDDAFASLKLLAGRKKG